MAYHDIPEDDFFRHEESSRCPCHPEVVYDPTTGEKIYVHQLASEVD